MASQPLELLVWQFLSLIAQKRHFETVDHQGVSISYNTKTTVVIPAFQLNVRDKNLSTCSCRCETHLVKFNTCRIYLNIIHLSDITRQDGKNID